jgi:hypothetical protein
MTNLWSLYLWLTDLFSSRAVFVFQTLLIQDLSDRTFGPDLLYSFCWCTNIYNQILAANQEIQCQSTHFQKYLTTAFLVIASLKY